MKILMVHCHGSEDQSTVQEALALGGRGHRVDLIEVSTAGAPAHELAAEALGLARGPALWMSDAIQRFDPDVIHFQNIFPRWGGAALNVARRSGITTVAAVRTYRMVCPAGTLWRDGKPCMSCAWKLTPWPAVVHGCSDGITRSAVAAAVNLRTRWHGVHLIAVSRPVAQILTMSHAVEPDDISIKPECIAGASRGTGAGGYVLYVGPTDDHEHGFAVLRDAWRLARLPDDQLMCVWPEHQDVLDLMGDAAFVVVPSLWPDPVGRVVIEAYSRGTPVLAARSGALGDLVSDATGWQVAPGDPNLLSPLLHKAMASAASKRTAAYQEWQALYSPEVNGAMLERIYRRAARARQIDLAA